MATRLLVLENLEMGSTRVRRKIVASGCLLLLAPLVACRPDSHGNHYPRQANLVPQQTATRAGVAMVIVPGGRFLMGSDQGAEDEAPRHEVQLAGFAIDKFEVTQDQYSALQLPNPAQFKGPRHPVEQVRWSDAALFCNERSRADGLEPCYDDVSFACNFEATGYRLPTEAEWEYAARAGDDRDVGGGRNFERELGKRACYAGTSTKRTEAVGQRKPNAWGLHDMLGNVAEWCNDTYAADFYADSPVDNPRGSKEGKDRVLRGGSWKSPAGSCRPTARAADAPGISDACFAQNNYGFRCVRRLTPEEASASQTAQP